MLLEQDQHRGAVNWAEPNRRAVLKALLGLSIGVPVAKVFIEIIKPEAVQPASVPASISAIQQKATVAEVVNKSAVSTPAPQMNNEVISITATIKDTTGKSKLDALAKPLVQKTPIPTTCLKNVPTRFGTGSSDIVVTADPKNEMCVDGRIVTKPTTGTVIRPKTTLAPTTSKPKGSPTATRDPWFGPPAIGGNPFEAFCPEELKTQCDESESGPQCVFVDPHDLKTSPNTLACSCIKPSEKEWHSATMPDGQKVQAQCKHGGDDTAYMVVKDAPATPRPTETRADSIPYKPSYTPSSNGGGFCGSAPAVVAGTVGFALIAGTPSGKKFARQVVHSVAQAWQELIHNLLPTPVTVK